MKKSALLGVGALGVVLVGAIGWRFKTKAADATMLDQSRAAGKGAPLVTVVKATGREVIEGIDVVGSLESPYDVKLSPKVAGRIATLDLREGAEVKPGQVLFTLDPTELQGQVLQAQASAAEARSRLAQAKLTQGANDTGIAAQIRSQQANLGSTRADFGQTQANYAAQVAAAESAVTDADAKITSAQAAIASAQADEDSAKANLASAQLKQKRNQELYDQGYVARQDLDDATTAVAVQQAALKVAQRKIDAAVSNLKSAKAERSAAAQQASIVKRKGQADIEAASARVKQANASLDVASANRSQKQAYQENLAALSSTVAAADASVRQAQARLSDAKIVSPVEGTITARTADPGSIASPGQPVLTVQFLKWLYVTANVPVEDSGKITAGMDAQFTVDAIPGRTFVGKVSDVSPAADAQSRQFLIRVKIDNPDHALSPGMFAHTRLVLNKVMAPVVVPREAVTKDATGSSVVIVDADMVAHKVPVKTGLEDPQGIEITEGVKPGDTVVSLSYAAVKDGQKVKLGGGKGEGKGGGKKK